MAELTGWKLSERDWSILAEKELPSKQIFSVKMVSPQHARQVRLHIQNKEKPQHPVYKVQAKPPTGKATCRACGNIISEGQKAIFFSYGENEKEPWRTDDMWIHQQKCESDKDWVKCPNPSCGSEVMNEDWRPHWNNHKLDKVAAYIEKWGAAPIWACPTCNEQTRNYDGKSDMATCKNEHTWKVGQDPTQFIPTPAPKSTFAWENCPRCGGSATYCHNPNEIYRCSYGHEWKFGEGVSVDPQNPPTTKPVPESTWESCPRCGKLATSQNATRNLYRCIDRHEWKFGEGTDANVPLQSGRPQPSQKAPIALPAKTPTTPAKPYTYAPTPPKPTIPRELLIHRDYAGDVDHATLRDWRNQSADAYTDEARCWHLPRHKITGDQAFALATSIFRANGIKKDPVVWWDAKHRNGGDAASMWYRDHTKPCKTCKFDSEGDGCAKCATPYLMFTPAAHDKQIVLHETAHLVDQANHGRKPPHGPEWRSTYTDLLKNHLGDDYANHFATGCSCPKPTYTAPAKPTVKPTPAPTGGDFVTRCRICESPDHWSNACPQNQKDQSPAAVALLEQQKKLIQNNRHEHMNVSGEIVEHGHNFTDPNHPHPEFSYYPAIQSEGIEHEHPAYDFSSGEAAFGYQKHTHPFTNPKHVHDEIEWGPAGSPGEGLKDREHSHLTNKGIIFTHSHEDDDDEHSHFEDKLGPMLPGGDVEHLHTSDDGLQIHDHKYTDDLHTHKEKGWGMMVGDLQDEGEDEESRVQKQKRRPSRCNLCSATTHTEENCPLDFDRIWGDKDKPKEQGTSPFDLIEGLYTDEEKQDRETPKENKDKGFIHGEPPCDFCDSPNHGIHQCDKFADFRDSGKTVDDIFADESPLWDKEKPKTEPKMDHDAFGQECSRCDGLTMVRHDACTVAKNGYKDGGCEACDWLGYIDCPECGGSGHTNDGKSSIVPVVKAEPVKPSPAPTIQPIPPNPLTPKPTTTPSTYKAPSKPYVYKPYVPPPEIDEPLTLFTRTKAQGKKPQDLKICPNCGEHEDYIGDCCHENGPGHGKMCTMCFEETHPETRTKKAMREFQGFDNFRARRVMIAASNARQIRRRDETLARLPAQDVPSIYDSAATVMELPQGWKIVSINTLGDAVYEGAMLGHCLADPRAHAMARMEQGMKSNEFGGHFTFPKVPREVRDADFPPHIEPIRARARGDSRIMSLRDSDNIPKASWWEPNSTPVGTEIREVAGMANDKIANKHTWRILQYMRKSLDQNKLPYGVFEHIGAIGPDGPEDYRLNEPATLDRHLLPELHEPYDSSANDRVRRLIP